MEIFNLLSSMKHGQTASADENSAIWWKIPETVTKWTLNRELFPRSRMNCQVLFSSLLAVEFQVPRLPMDLHPPVHIIHHFRLVQTNDVLSQQI